ncbi:MAG: FtsX-like permease family protein [Armatimonadetes bacterium]|nr:FtsX-like permease family protein [Armatimonadota bacterium]
MADETKDTASPTGGEATARQAFEQLSAEEKVKLLAGDRVDALSEEEISARLSGLDSGDTLGHDDVVEGMAHELSAQGKVIDLLSTQAEEEGLNVAKVLDSSSVDLEFLMRVQVTEPTRNIIGPTADKARREHIQEEIALPNSTAFQMCLRSVFIRIGRVAITASGIFLGIAFLASVQTTAAIQRVAGEGAVVQEDRARMIWLIVMALMVSVVGIANSMLMAVTERFQEIGTMKCLGALDQFIVKLFLIESGLLGGLAGLTGSIVGILLMYIVNMFKYEFHFTSVALGLLGIVASSMILGTVLSIVAAILPARQAARMPAAAALRTTV